MNSSPAATSSCPMSRVNRLCKTRDITLYHKMQIYAVAAHPPFITMLPLRALVVRSLLPKPP